MEVRVEWWELHVEVFMEFALQVSMVHICLFDFRVFDCTNSEQESKCFELDTWGKGFKEIEAKDLGVPADYQSGFVQDY